MRRTGLKKNKRAFLYCYPDDPYFNFILIRICKRNIATYPDADHIFYPIYGIRVYSSLDSKYPPFLKHAALFCSYIKKEFIRFNKARNQLRTFLTRYEFRKVSFVSPYQWLISLFFSLPRLKDFRKVMDISCQQFIDKFKIDQMPAGDLLVDTYLRYKGVAVADINNWFFKDIVWRGYAIANIHKMYLRKYGNILLYGSYATYIDHGIGLRLFCNAGQPSVTFASHKTPYQIHKNLLDNQLPRHEGYHENLFPSNAQALSQDILIKAEKSLINRCKQNYDHRMNYMASTSKTTGSGYERENIPGSIILMLHDFFDSVHGYRWLIFPDFYQWAFETICFCIRNGITINVKPHPNQRPESQLIINKLVDEFKGSNHLHWIDKTSPNNELFALNPSLLISVYGSIAPEAAFQGIKVLLAGDYPGVNFNIGKVSTSRKEYFNLIRFPELIENPKREHAILFNACIFKNSFEEKFCSLYEFLGANNIDTTNLNELIASSKASRHLDKLLSKLTEDLND